MSRTVFLLAILAVVLFAANCGGSDSGGPVVPVTDTNVTIAPNPLSGTINARNFLVPAGTTVIMTGNTVVNATESIQIDGSILMDDLTSLEMTAGTTMSINGAIQPNLPAARQVSARVDDFIEGERIFLDAQDLEIG